MVIGYKKDKIKTSSNEIKEETLANEPKSIINFFSIYDGYGGDLVSSYLQKRLLSLLTNDKELLLSPLNAIRMGFKRIQKELREMSSRETTSIPSGSSALVLITIDDMFYIANLGNSKGMISKSLGLYVNSLTQSSEQRIEYTHHPKLGVGSIKGVLTKFHSRNISSSKSTESTPSPKGLKIINNTSTTIPGVASFHNEESLDFILLGSNFSLLI